MAKETTQVWALVQQYMDSQRVRVSQSAVADAVGVQRSALSQWKYGQTTPSPANLRELQRVTRIPYRLFLDALLVDLGYLEPDEELMGNAKHPAAIGEVTVTRRAGRPVPEIVQEDVSTRPQPDAG